MIWRDILASMIRLIKQWAIKYNLWLISRVYKYDARERAVNQFTSSPRSIQSIRHHSNNPTIINETNKIYGRSELDSHADTIVAGKNCIVLKYTAKTCEVSPYSEEYEPVKNVPVVQAATGYTTSTGNHYVLILNEALYMPSLDHSLINPNQLRHYQAKVEDNPYACSSLVLITN